MATDKNNTNTSNGKNNTLIETGFFTINGNSLTFDTHLLQMRNITRVWTGQLPKKPLAIKALIILVIVSIICFEAEVIWVGIISLLIVAYLIYRYKTQTIYHGINIEVSSCRTFSFVCENQEYVKKAFDCLNECICKESNNNIFEINLNNGIINSGIINQSNVTGREKTSE